MGKENIPMQLFSLYPVRGPVRAGDEGGDQMMGPNVCAQFVYY